MYIYFDRNGTIKEVINDESIRRGSNDYNKIYCYLEGNPDIDDIWYLQKNPDGTLTNEVSFVDNVVTKAIPYDSHRDMKYFQDFEEYQFYVFTLSSSYLSQNGLVVATIRVAENNTLWALGELTFNVQANVINSDNEITQSQYDYLLLSYASRTLNEQTGSDLNNLLDDKIEAKANDIIEPIFNDYKETIDEEVENQNETIASLIQASPRVFDTASNIALLTENKGVAVATDTGYIYYWDSTLTTPAYVSSGLQYNNLDDYVKHENYQLKDANNNNIYPVLSNSVYEDLLTSLYPNVERKRYNNYGFVSVTYAISLTTPTLFPYDVALKCNSGFKFKVHYWKTNATGQSNYIMQSANWYTTVYIPKNTYFTFDFRKEDESTITLADKEKIHLTLKIDYGSISVMNTYIKNILKPTYWDGTNHIFPSSATRVTATEILFANDDIPIHIIDNTKLAFIVYYVESDGTAIDNSGYLNTDYVIPKGSYFVFSMRNYSNTVIKDVDELISYLSFGESEYFEKLFGTEMFIPNNISTNNEDAKIRLENNHYLRGANEKRFTLLHFSDIHGNSETLRRIIKYRNNISTLLDDSICTGDLVNGRFSDDFNYWLNISDAKTILLTVGNHDSFTANSYNDSDLASMNDVATKFYAPLISNWNVTNYTANTTYYYKDYASKKIRLIVLDSQRIGTDATTQLTWLQNALTDAITNNYAVIIAMHYFPSQNVKQYDCSFSMYQYRTYNLSSEYVGFDVVGAVDTFIANGGEFITYIVGHKHADGFGYIENHNNQTVSIVTCANPSKNSTGSDQSRNTSNSSYDAFNLLTIDTDRKYLQLVRVGATKTMFNLDRVSLCFNYSNKTFIKS